MRRGLAIAIAAIVVIFCIAVVVVYTSVGSVLVAVVEKYGMEITGSTVTVKEADFEPSTGTGILVNLSVGNPVGYGKENAFFASDIDIQIDPETVSSAVITIKRLKIEAPEVIYEITANGDNLRTLRGHIQNAITQEKSLTRNSTPGERTKKFIVNDLYINNGVVIVRTEDLDGKRATAIIDNIHLEDLGRDEGGISPAELVDRIYGPLLRATSVAALSTDMKLTDQARNILQGAVDETEDVVKQIKKLLK